MYSPLVARLAPITGVALVLAGCAAPAPPTGSSSGPAVPAPPPVAQTLSFGASPLAVTLDPAVSTSGTVRKYDMFETLTTYDDKATVKPMLATGWETVDSQTWRFTLRTDSKFHDGTLLTAKDVEFSWKRANDPALKAQAPGNMVTVDTITAADAKTVVVKTKAPDPILPRRFFFLAILPQAAFEKSGEQAFWLSPVGSGPFKFKEFKADDHLTITGWTEHPSRKPKLTEITIRNVTDPTARVAGLRTGTLDMINTVPVDTVTALIREGYQYFRSDTATLKIGFDTWGTDGTDVGPIGDQRVRQAINYAVDRETIAKNLWQGLSKPTGTALAEGTLGYDPTIVPYKYDLAKAKALMAQSGYPNGFSIKAEFVASLPEIQTTFLAIQSQLKEIGIAVELLQIDSATSVEKVYKRKPPAPMLSSVSNPAPVFDSDANFAFFYSGTTLGKRYANPEFDVRYLAQRQEMDPVKRENILKEMARIAQEDPYQIAAVTIPLVTIWNKTVSVPTVGVDGFPFLELISRTAP